MTREDLAISVVTGLAVAAILVVLATAPAAYGFAGPLSTTTATTTTTSSTRCVDDWHPVTGEDCPRGPI